MNILIILLFFSSVLNLSPGHVKAEHCRMVCLVQLGKFEEALKFFGTINVDLRNDLIVEKAYCEYRLNRITDALRTLGSSKSIAAQELRVQAVSFDFLHSGFLS